VGSPAVRRCKDCPSGSRRPAPHPGPRCATHHRERRKAAARRRAEQHQLQAFGLTPEDRAAILAFQDGLCAICGPWTGYNGKTRALSTDHCHKTGIVRGALCKHCNDLLGRVRDSPEALERAAEYLRNPPAVRAIGIRIVPHP